VLATGVLVKRLDCCGSMDGVIALGPLSVNLLCFVGSHSWYFVVTINVVKKSFLFGVVAVRTLY